MSLVVVFEVRGELAHFRRPDTLGTHATYPFPTRTALRGLIAAVLGEPAWPDGGKWGCGCWARCGRWRNNSRCTARRGKRAAAGLNRSTAPRRSS